MDSDSVRNVGVLVTILVGGGGITWFLGRRQQVEGNILAARRQSRIKAQIEERIWRGHKLAEQNVAAMNNASDNRDGPAWKPIHQAARETIYMANRAMSEKTEGR